MRTDPGAKLLELAIASQVAFEIDGHTSTDAWSVVATGSASRIDTQREIVVADTLPLSPWLPTLKSTCVRITPGEVSGRAFLRGEHGSRSLV